MAIQLRVFPLLLVLLHLHLSFVSSAPASYSTHCPTSDSQPDLSSGDPIRGDPLPTFVISSATFSGAESVFGPATSRFSPNSLSFLPHLVRRTIEPNTLHVSGTLTLVGGRSNSPLPRIGGRGRGRNASRGGPHLPRAMVRPRSSVSVQLDGYWSYSTSNLCMVGDASGRSVQGKQIRFPAVFSVSYPRKSKLTTSFLTGALKSTDDTNNNGGGGFESVSFVAYAEGLYEYSQIDAARKMCPSVAGRGALQADSSFSCDDVVRMFRGGYDVRYVSGSASASLGLHNSVMSLNQVYCDKKGGRNVRAYVALGNETRSPFNFWVGEAALLAEGFWDGENGRLCLSACRVSSGGDWKVGECSLGMSFWFPAVWSLEDRSVAKGVVSGGSGSEDGVVSLRSVATFRGSLSGVKYNYTRIVDAKNFFLKSKIKLKKGKYPDGNSYGDFSFTFFSEERGFGVASPVSIGSVLFDGRILWGQQDKTPALINQTERILNISYAIYYGVANSSVGEELKMSAEGFYDVENGFLCMIGCREVNGTMDCQVGITVQFAPLNGRSGDHLKGTISSMRDSSDPLFFKPLEIHSQSIYTEQAAESLWRMDLESTMVLISLTLSCVFIVLQLFHVRRNPDVLPSISLTMLVTLSLGYMIPLVLNFEALFFMSRSKQTLPFLSGGWLEVNEVVVRVMTMVAFLLQLRLLQLTWSARSVDEKKSWDAEKKSLWICLPLYLIGGLVTLIVHISSHQDAPKVMPVQGVKVSSVEHSFLEDVMAYTGLILDGFLVPQVIFNSFSDSKSKALAHSFYIGSSMIRALPHVYDAFRAQNFLPRLRPSYIYASPREDLYNLAWDVIIPCGVVLLSLLVFLQQRFGGAFFLRLTNRKSREYEMVPTVSS